MLTKAGAPMTLVSTQTKGSLDWFLLDRPGDINLVHLGEALDVGPRGQWFGRLVDKQEAQDSLPEPQSLARWAPDIRVLLSAPALPIPRGAIPAMRYWSSAQSALRKSSATLLNRLMFCCWIRSRRSFQIVNGSARCFSSGER